jgi:Protein of unknown function (DUF1385)
VRQAWRVRHALRQADLAPVLPRLGGMARPNGVVIVSERYWAFSGVDGTLVEGSMPTLSPLVRRTPLLRGLAKLALAFAPVMRRGGTTRGIERFGLLAALALPFALVLVSERVALAVGFAVTALLFWLLFRGRTLALHGAEHRAIAAVESRRMEAAWEGSARPSRFSLRCGTNFAALAAPITFAADQVWPLSVALWTPLAVTMLSLALTMELWQLVQASSSRLARALLLPGLALQRVTTREPELGETRIALRAVESVLRRSLQSK